MQISANFEKAKALSLACETGAGYKLQMTFLRLLLPIAFGLTVSTTMNFIAGPPAQGRCGLVASPNATVANGNSTINLSFIARDAYNNPVANLSVSLSGSGNNNAFGAASGATDANGNFITTLSSALAQNETITAAFNNGNAVSAAVSFVPGSASAATSSFVLSPNSTVANNSNTLVGLLTLQDAQANPIAGVAPSYSASGNSTTITTSGATSATGQSSAAFKTGLAQNQNALAAAGGLNFVAPMVFVAGPPTAAASTFNASPNSLLADGTSQATLTTTARDAQGNSVPAISVSLVGSGGNNVFGAANGNTNTSGVYTTTLQSSQVQNETLTATLNGNITEQVSIAFTVGPANASSSSFAVTPKTQLDDNNSIITATLTLKDAQAHPISGVTPSFSASGTATTLSSAKATDANGQSTVSCRSSQAQNQNLTVSAAGLGYTTTVAFIPGPVSTSYSFISANPATLAADNNTTTMLSVHLADNTNNSIASQRVSYYTSGGAGPFARAATVTNSFGNTNNLLSSQQLGANKIYASAQNVLLSTTVTYTGPSAYCSGNPNYYAKSTLTGLSSPSCVAVADFNGDGKLDISLASNSNQINVYLSNADGTFGTAIASYAGGGCAGVALGDLNADGIVDIVYASGQSTTSTAFGVGNGSFTSATSYSSGYATFSVSVDDLNSDGFLDVVVAAYYNSGPTLFFNTGTGALGSSFALSATGGSYHAITGDFNGDGIRDIAYSNGGGNSNNTLDIYIGNGNMTYAPPVRYVAGAGPRYIAVGDFNADGNQDIIIAANGNNYINLFTGTGSGTFNAPSTYATGQGPSGVTSADLNGDGYRDIVAVNDGKTYSVLINNGSGGFNSQVGRAISVVNNQAIGIGDFNGDARMDLAVLGGSSSMTVNLYNACN